MLPSKTKSMGRTWWNATTAFSVHLGSNINMSCTPIIEPAGKDNGKRVGHWDSIVAYKV